MVLGQLHLWHFQNQGVGRVGFIALIGRLILRDDEDTSVQRAMSLSFIMTLTSI